MLSLPGYDIDDVPRQVLDHPGMTTRREKAMLYWLAKNTYEGDGVIVDAGVFLGASTNAFATGIKAGRAAARGDFGRFKPINSYDTAIWVSSMDRYLDLPATRDALNGRTILWGDSFLPVLRDLLAAHHDLVDLRLGDIVEVAAADRPIEIAFYDCLKTAERDAAAFRAFAPCYAPGTIVVQQDYFYESAADLKIRQEYLSPCFTYLGAEATSAVFRLDRPVPEAYFHDDPIRLLSPDEKVALLLQAAERTADPKLHLYAKLAVVEFLAAAGEHDGAREFLHAVAAATRHSPERFGPRMSGVISGHRKRLAV